uniref:5'-3' exonuclease domain-containing protein n=1 Tax=viral metagenome TaxID=1070528 RepID=A0A6C0I6Y7_9ZZZZ
MATINNTVNIKKTFIFIDGSYFCFYRYHSLLTWWKNAYPENILDDPFLNEQFVAKFRKTFVEHVQSLRKNLGIHKSVIPTIIVGRDCKRENIWRNELFPNYKATRANGKEDGFMGGPFFKMVYQDNLFIEGGAKALLSHPTLEADDCIALSVKHVLQKYQSCDVYIITSDKDYLQLAEPRVHIYNLGFKKITDQKSSTGSAECDLFCKIVMGDISDNIPSVFPKCGPKTALKYYEDQASFQTRLQSSDVFQAQYNINKKIVDFNEIPGHLKNELFTNCDAIINEFL